RRTGEAVHLDVAMLDTSMMLMASLVTSHLTGGWMPQPSGNEAWSQSPSSGAFETQDGLLMIAANNDRQFRALCAGIGRPDILEAERWREPDDRRCNAAALRAELVAILRTDTALNWERALDAAGVPAAKVRSLDETLAEEHSRTRALTKVMRWERQPQDIHLPTLGFKANGEAVGPSTPPPALGEDTHVVLSELGYSDDDIRRLRENGDA